MVWKLVEFRGGSTYIIIVFYFIFIYQFCPYNINLFIYEIEQNNGIIVDSY